MSNNSLFDSQFPRPHHFALPTPSVAPSTTVLRLGAPIGAPTIFPCVTYTKRADSILQFGPNSKCPWPGISAEIVDYLMNGVDQKYEVVPLYGKFKFQNLLGMILNGTLDGSLRLWAPEYLHPSRDYYRVSDTVLFKPFTVSILFSKNLTEDSILDRLLVLFTIFDRYIWALFLMFYVFLKIVAKIVNGGPQSKRKLLNLVVKHGYRFAMIYAVMNLLIAGLFRAGLLSTLLAPQQELLIRNEETYFTANAQRKFTTYTEMQFYIRQYQDALLKSNRTLSGIESQTLGYMKSLSENPIVNVRLEEEALQHVEDGTGVLGGVRYSLAYWKQRMCNVDIIDLHLLSQLSAGTSDAVVVFNRNVPQSVVDKINHNLIFNRAAINRIEQRYTQRMEDKAKTLKRCANIQNYDSPKPLSLPHMVNTFTITLLGAVCGLAGLVVELLKNWADNGYSRLFVPDMYFNTAF